MKMTFLKLLLICIILKNPNFAEKSYKFGGKSFKKLNSTEFMEFVLSKSVCHMSCVRCKKIQIRIIDKEVELVGGSSVINGAYLIWLLGC